MSSSVACLKSVHLNSVFEVSDSTSCLLRRDVWHFDINSDVPKKVAFGLFVQSIHPIISQLQLVTTGRNKNVPSLRTIGSKEYTEICDRLNLIFKILGPHVYHAARLTSISLILEKS